MSLWGKPWLGMFTAACLRCGNASRKCEDRNDDEKPGEDTGAWTKGL